MQSLLVPFLLVVATAMRECVEPKEQWEAVPAGQTDEFPLGFRTTTISSNFNTNTENPHYPCVLINASKGTKFEILAESNNINGGEKICSQVPLGWPLRRPLQGWEVDQVGGGLNSCRNEQPGKLRVCAQMGDYAQRQKKADNNNTVPDGMMVILFFCKSCPEESDVPISYRIRQAPGDDVDREEHCDYWDEMDPDPDGPHYPSEAALVDLPPARLPDSARNNNKDNIQEDVGGEEGNTTITTYLLALLCVVVAIITIVFVCRTKGRCKNLYNPVHTNGSDGEFEMMKHQNLNLDDASVSASDDESESIESLEVEVHA